MALDPYYNNVSLLLPMEGANNQTGFVDYSPSPKAITRAGDTKISTAQSKWGNGSAYFDGTGDYLAVTTPNQFNDLVTPFTLEFWLRASGGITTNKYPVIYSAEYSAPRRYTFFYYGTTGQTTFTLGMTNLLANEYLTISGININQWYHVAYVGIGNKQVKLYVDGVLRQSITFTTTLNVGEALTCRVGNGVNFSEAMTGYLQDFRVTPNIARYTANFTPPERLLSPELYGAKYLHRGTLPTLKTITGNVIVSGNGGAQQVVIREVATRLLVATAVPDPTTGAWTANVPPGNYDITYFAPDCQPICHGPYTVTA